MKKITFSLVSAAFILLGAITPLTAESKNPDTASVWAGKARHEITPPAGTPLAGFGRRRGKPSAGVHDPLYARAIALQKGPETFVFVSADLVLIDEELREATLKKINKTTKLESRQLLLTATHTHSGSGAIGGRFWERFIMGKFRKDIFEITADGIAKAVTDAMDDLRPAAAEYGEINIDELLENRIGAKAGVPNFLKVLRFKSDIRGANQVFAALVFMAAHPTLLPSSNMLFSADFPGEITQNLENFYPGSSALFINGAAGDLRPKAENFEDRFEKSRAYGFRIAKEIEKISFTPANLNGPWNAVIHRQKLPRTQIRAGFLKVPSLLGNRVFPRKSYFQGLRAGSFFFFGFPGELASETGLAIESQAMAFGLKPSIAGYANDYIGYVIPRHFYRDRENYESRASFYGPKMDWFVEDQAQKIILELLTPEENSRPANRGHYLLNQIFRYSRQMATPIISVLRKAGF